LLLKTVILFTLISSECILVLKASSELAKETADLNLNEFSGSFTTLSALRSGR